jgi:hypothetical protein
MTVAVSPRQRIERGSEVLSLDKTIVAVSISTVRRAERRFIACEHCDPTADTPFGRVLDAVGGNVADVRYLMPEAAHCPGCGAPIFEHHLVELW